MRDYGEKKSLPVCFFFSKLSIIIHENKILIFHYSMSRSTATAAEYNHHDQQ